MTDIEQKYGKHTVLVEAFITHLKSGSVDWAAARDASDAAWDASDAAWDAASDAASVDVSVAASDASSDAASDAVSEATRDAAYYAACEIIGHELLAERDKPLVFLPMFGLDIEKLKEMVK